MFNSSNVYKELPYVDTEQIVTQSLYDLNDIVMKFQGCVPEVDLLYLKSLKIQDVILPSMSLMPKVHKLKQKASSAVQFMLKGRPIVNGFAAVTVTASRLFHKFIVKLRNKLCDKFIEKNLCIPTINDRNKFIKNIQNVKWSSDLLTKQWLVTFDFESLFTNVKIYHVLHTLLSLRELLNIDNNEHRFAVSMCNYILNHTYFHVGHNRLYKQTSGLAMGAYDSGEVASLVLLYREFLALQDDKLHNVIMLNRYVDDGFCIIRGCSIQDVYNTLDILLKYYPKDINIEIIVNKISVQYLDVCTEISDQTILYNSTSTRVYQKPFNTYCYPHFHSSIPRSIHINVIRNECKRYKEISSNRREYDHICKLFKLRLSRCSYPKTFVDTYITEYLTCFAKRPKQPFSKFLVKVRYDNRVNQVNIIKRILNKYSRYRNKFLFCNVFHKKLKSLTLTKRIMHNKISKCMV